MNARFFSVLLVLVLALATVAQSLASFPPAAVEAQLEAAQSETGWAALPIESNARARLELAAARRHPWAGRLLPVTPHHSPAFRRYAFEVNRRPVFHCRQPSPRSEADDPAPH